MFRSGEGVGRGGGIGWGRTGVKCVGWRASVDKGTVGIAKLIEGSSVIFYGV